MKFRIFIKKFYVIFLILLWLPVYGQNDPYSVLRFETEQEYVDFYYSLQSVLQQIYPKLSMGWVQRNTSQYQSDLDNIILLADRDFNNSKKVSSALLEADDLGPMIGPLIKSGVVLLAKRRNAKEQEAIWVVVVGFQENGAVLIINDSKLGPYLKIPSRDIGPAYYFSVHSGK
ncbi:MULTISPECIES: hypothetical protein [Leptospira]|uniref:hypothetical protein n=1 Tax=Leptospira TaxID=171 RepID=UPI000AD102BB|nr:MULTISPECIES: hypothetical protein [Leptospira]